MNRYEIFKSEGGYRYAGIVVNGGPVMSASPWFKTKTQAERAASKKQEEESAQAARDRDWYGI